MLSFEVELDEQGLFVIEYDAFPELTYKKKKTWKYELGHFWTLVITKHFTDSGPSFEFRELDFESESELV